MTEDEAKKKFCPLMPLALGPNAQPTMTSSYLGSASGGTGYAIPVRQFNCQGSDCMMWKWSYFVERHKEKGVRDNSEGGPAKGRCGFTAGHD